MNTQTPYPHITRNQRGEPTIIGTRTRVQSIVSYYKLGMSVEEIHASLPYLSDAELHAAFGYYFDNREEIERLIDEEDEFYQQAKAQYGTVEDLIWEKSEAKQREMAVKA
ncbi:MAG: DUF433 domain-containing protein [Candidatus Kapabacteria bacterium]|jgi:uncharacterized protein (DUF433 family)|nr:DUF433 domain-containing protein [Candidatus Kapabacteria bacterium]